MFDEPRNHPQFLFVLGLLVLCSIPFPFIGGELKLCLGLPTWLWWSITFTTGLAIATAWAILHLWRDDQHE
jgi:hypothetical protein